MTDLATVPTDDLVAEVERRLEQGVLGFHGLYATNQQDFREMWIDLGEWVHEQSNAAFDDTQRLRLKMLEIVDRHDGERVQARRGVYAVNRTFHGRAAEENHQPEATP